MLIVFPACFGDKKREYHQFLMLPFFSYKRFYFCFFLRAQPSSLKSGSSPFSLLLFFLLLSLLKNCFQSSCFFGPKYGKLLNAIRTALTEVDGNATMDKLNESGSFELNVEGQAIELSKDDVLIEMTQKEGFVASSDKGITVVLDTNLTPELIEEGFVREVISKVQTMRKDAGFEVMDKINLYVSGNDKIADIVNKNAAQVKTVVLAQDIITGKTAGFEKEWDINGEKVTLAVEKLA